VEARNSKKQLEKGTKSEIAVEIEALAETATQGDKDERNGN
jgi:hypothetical protein